MRDARGRVAASSSFHIRFNNVHADGEESAAAAAMRPQGDPCMGCVGEIVPGAPAGTAAAAAGATPACGKTAFGENQMKNTSTLRGRQCQTVLEDSVLRRQLRGGGDM